MIHRKNIMIYEEYGNFVDVENNMTSYFPDNLKYMSEKYQIRSINRNLFKYKQLHKFKMNVDVNIMTTIPEINENSINGNCHSNCHSNCYKNIQCSYDKGAIFILLLCAFCFKYYYFLRNFV